MQAYTTTEQLKRTEVRSSGQLLLIFFFFFAPSDLCVQICPSPFRPETETWKVSKQKRQDNAELCSLTGVRWRRREDCAFVWDHRPEENVANKRCLKYACQPPCFRRSMPHSEWGAGGRNMPVKESTATQGVREQKQAGIHSKRAQEAFWGRNKSVRIY